jgi:hypothetical protein
MLNPGRISKSRCLTLESRELTRVAGQPHKLRRRESLPGFRKLMQESGQPRVIEAGVHGV